MDNQVEPIEQKELSEEQFATIKHMVSHGTLIALAPHNKVGDSNDDVEKYLKLLIMYYDLVDQKFMENVTSWFLGMLVDIRAKGERTFEAFALTETAIALFQAPEGLVH